LFHSLEGRALVVIGQRLLQYDHHAVIVALVEHRGGGRTHRPEPQQRSSFAVILTLASLGALASQRTWRARRLMFRIARRYSNCWPGTRRRVGDTSGNTVIAAAVSARASAAPTQWWMPWPNARCARRFGRAGSWLAASR
jgi:hypothetical protein